jgi:hypothetical protein
VKDYAKILRIWLEHHPDRDNPEAPLWVKKQSGSYGNKYESNKKGMAHEIVKKASKNAGIKRTIHLHMWRHTENTLETKQHVHASARRKLHGWSQTSNTPAIYEHLTDTDAINEVLKSHGIVETRTMKDSFEPLKCGYCGETNPSGNKYCSFYGVPLGEEESEKLLSHVSLRNGRSN